jgi:sialidase-1
MNLLMRRSTDGGKTWEAIKVIDSSKGAPVGNPTPIVDDKGVIHLLYQKDYAQAFYTWSDDDGNSWKVSSDITPVFSQFKPEYNWNVLAPGPGHGIQLKNGRLLAAVWLANSAKLSPRRSHGPSCVATIYSDDHGKTWNRGAIVADSSAAISNPNESMPVQLADGTVLLSIRNPGSIKRRAFSTRSDGIGNWSKVRFEEELFDPTCMASIIALSAQNKNDKPAILFVNPDSRNIEKHPRQNLTAKLSYDGGYTWPVQKVLNSGPSGYSDLAVGPDGTIYCLYETNTVGKGFNYSLLLKKIDRPWLLKQNN